MWGSEAAGTASREEHQRVEGKAYGLASIGAVCKETLTACGGACANFRRLLSPRGFLSFRTMHTTSGAEGDAQSSPSPPRSQSASSASPQAAMLLEGGGNRAFWLQCVTNIAFLWNEADLKMDKMPHFIFPEQSSLGADAGHRLRGMAKYGKELRTYVQGH